MIFIQFAILHLFVLSAWSNEFGKIVNGTDAEEGQFPHQISLQNPVLGHFCGGSIISDEWVVTAVHCLEGEVMEELTVLAGTISLSRGGITVKIKQLIVHNEHDIALLELMERLIFTETIKPIKMVRNEIPAGSNIIVSGWGSLDLVEGGTKPDVLQYNKNTITNLSPKFCETILSLYKLNYYDGLICLDHGKFYGACSGDSGGPAVYDGQLVGVASFVILGCASHNPDVFVKISYFRDWINEQTGLDF